MAYKPFPWYSPEEEERLLKETGAMQAVAPSVANEFSLMNLIRPVAPGLPGAANPLAFIGAGMAQGNPLGALQAMTGARLGADRTNQGLMALQQSQQQAAIANQQKMDAMRQQRELAMARMSAPTGLQQNLSWAFGLPEGDPRRAAAIANLTKPDTTVNVTSGDASRAAQAESALDIGRELEGLIAAGAVNPEGIAGLWTKLREQPTITGAIARLTDDLSADESRAVQLSEMLSQQLLQAMRGAQVGPLEEERFKAALPVFGKPNYSANLRTTLQNITNLENRRRELRGMPAIETPATGTSNVRILGIRKVSD